MAILLAVLFFLASIILFGIAPKEPKNASATPCDFFSKLLRMVMKQNSLRSNRVSNHSRDALQIHLQAEARHYSCIKKYRSAKTKDESIWGKLKKRERKRNVKSFKLFERSEFLKLRDDRVNSNFQQQAF